MAAAPHGGGGGGDGDPRGFLLCAIVDCTRSAPSQHHCRRTRHRPQPAIVCTHHAGGKLAGAIMATTATLVRVAASAPSGRSFAVLCALRWLVGTLIAPSVLCYRQPRMLTHSLLHARSNRSAHGQAELRKRGDPPTLRNGVPVAPPPGGGVQARRCVVGWTCRGILATLGTPPKGQLECRCCMRVLFGECRCIWDSLCLHGMLCLVGQRLILLAGGESIHQGCLQGCFAPVRPPLRAWCCPRQLFTRSATHSAAIRSDCGK